MSDKSDRVSRQAKGEDLKPYAKPILSKGPRLGNIAAAITSGVV